MTVDWQALHTAMAAGIRTSPVCADFTYEGATIRAHVVENTDDDGAVALGAYEIHAYRSDLHATPIGRTVVYTPPGGSPQVMTITELADTGGGWCVLRAVLQ